MRLAQFDVGGGVQCVVFQGISGSDEQNVDRWIGQMGPDAGPGAKVTESERDGVKVTRLEVRGTYTDTMRQGAPTIPEATMLAAVVTSPAAKLHVRIVGPSAVVDAAAAQFDAFIASMKPR